MEHIGEAIRYYRRRRGLTQEQLATGAHLSPGHIVRLENGEVRNPRLGTVQDLEEALGLNGELSQFVIGPPVMSNPTTMAAGDTQSETPVGGTLATAARRNYVTNATGERVGVILGIEEYRRILEDLEDLEALRAADEALREIARGEDEVIPLEEALREIREGKVTGD